MTGAHGQRLQDGRFQPLPGVERCAWVETGGASAVAAEWGWCDAWQCLLCPWTGILCRLMVLHRWWGGGGRGGRLEGWFYALRILCTAVLVYVTCCHAALYGL